MMHPDREECIGPSSHQNGHAHPPRNGWWKQTPTESSSNSFICIPCTGVRADIALVTHILALYTTSQFSFSLFASGRYPKFILGNSGNYHLFHLPRLVSKISLPF
uniref:Uncharacterized protein n=1 Tax=Sphaerodactylus townsendi TaxID=933632 RepID=A0ACB8ERF3_9SAUR